MKKIVFIIVIVVVSMYFSSMSFCQASTSDIGLMAQSNKDSLYKEVIEFIKESQEQQRLIFEKSQEQQDKILELSSKPIDNVMKMMNLIISISSILIFIVPSALAFYYYKLENIKKINDTTIKEFESIKNTIENIKNDFTEIKIMSSVENLKNLEESMMQISEKTRFSQLQIDIQYGNKTEKWTAIGYLAQIRNPVVIPILARCIRDNDDHGILIDALYGLSKHGSNAEKTIVEYEIFEKIVVLSHSENEALINSAIDAMKKNAPELPAFKMRLREIEENSDKS